MRNLSGATHLCLIVGATLALAACGGGSGGQSASAPPPVASPAPAPTPTPTPTPPPPAFQPVAATIFAEPLYNSQLVVAGKGWQFDYVPNVAGSRNVRDADGFSVSYDPASGTYFLSAPLLGSGKVLRIENSYQTEPAGSSFAAVLATDAHAAAGAPGSMRVQAADQANSRYRYATFLDFGRDEALGVNLQTTAYGVIGVAQPTRAGEVPTTGMAHYDGHVHGAFAGDAGATWLEGKARLDFDFASALLAGNLTVGMRCMMGCSYDEVVYQIAETSFVRGGTTFNGKLTTPGATSTGMFSGLFAGPGAVELMAQFRLPFFNPEYQRWMDAGGIIVAKRD